MLCSVSTGKSGTNWLDRLRSSKGFPTGTDLDLDHQNLNNLSESPISKSTDPNPNNTDPNPSSPPEKRPALNHNQNQDKDLYNALNNVLCDLFNFGDSDNTSTRIKPQKTSRKQQHPRICDVSKPTNDVRSEEDNNLLTSASGGDNSGGLGYGNVGGEVEEEEECDGDFSGFSRSEVTVIDTSCATWKFDKLLFRKKDVWRVRDKKSKVSMNAEKKKKKMKGSVLDENEGVSGEKKKAKGSVGECSFLKEGSYGEEGDLMPSNEDHHQDHKTEEVYKETTDILTQVPKKRSLSTLKKQHSSVILIKSIPTSKKNVASMAKSCPKSTQRQLEA